jgi:hypothetical protein
LQIANFLAISGDVLVAERICAACEVHNRCSTTVGRSLATPKFEATRFRTAPPRFRSDPT